jgi:hypothetical protein
MDRTDFASAHAVGNPALNREARKRAWTMTRTQKPGKLTDRLRFGEMLQQVATDHRQKELLQ